MTNTNAGLTIDTAGVARYNGIPLKADQPFPGSRVRTDRTPNTVIRVLGRDLPYIEARLRTLQRPWQWVSHHTISDLSELRSCNIRIVAEDYGFDAAQFGEVGKSLFSKEHNIEQSIFLFNFSLSIETKISGKTVTDTIKVDKNYFRLRSSTSPKAEKVLSSSCGCRSNVATALVFPDYFTKSDREFGYQVKKSAQYRTGFKTLVRFVLKPYEDNDRLQQIGLEPTHKRHYTYNTSKSKVVEAVRMCARFFQIFYPTSIDKEHFTNAVDDICESVMPAASVNNSNNHYHNAQPPAYPGTTATYTASPLAATNNNWSNDPYQQLDAAMEAIARLQVKDILRHGTGEPVRKQLVEAALKERMKTMLHTRMRPVLTTAMNKETSEYVLDRSQDSYH